MHVLIAGAGIAGLTTALSLHAAGFEATVVDAAADLKPIGAGINLQPHAMRELEELGLLDEIYTSAVAIDAMDYVDRHGTLILSVPRGRAAGYKWPQCAIHRGSLQRILLAAVLDRLGPSAVQTGTQLCGLTESADGVTVDTRDRRTGATGTTRADLLIGADGLHSTVRGQLHPDQGPPMWNGIRMWRGISHADPYLDGHTMVVAGSNKAGKFVTYPIATNQMNWLTEITVSPGGPLEGADWTQRGRLEDFLPRFADWRFGWLDAPALIKAAEPILVFPMVDRDPLPWWGRGRLTLIGDAAHPMYPIGSNGGSQAILDARVLAHRLATIGDPAAALASYENERRPKTTRLVMDHRSMAVEAMLDTVTERAPGGFADIRDVLTAEEIRSLEAMHHRINDKGIAELNEAPSLTVRRPK